MPAAAPDRSRFEAIAPRLARAHAQERARLAQRDHDRAVLLDAVLRLERLVAHRELQLIRAGAKRSPQYLRRRQDKLRNAEKALARVRTRLLQL